MTQTNQTIIKYNISRQINLGDVFYTIEDTDKKFYYEPCKVCEGKGQLTINDITFTCPCCREYRSPFSIARYKVTRWRVYEISQSLSNGYWQKGSVEPINVHLYTTTSRGYGNIKRLKLTEHNFKMFRNVEADEIIKIADSRYGRLDEYVFDCYSHACNVADELNKYEEQKVIQHNKENGTNYELPPKPKYDARSN